MDILELRKSVLIELPESKDSPVEQLMLDGIRDLCKETYCWKEATTTTSTINQPTYPLTITTTNAEIIGFWEGSYNDVKLDNLSEREMDQRDKSWESRIGTPNGIIYDGNKSIRFNITPNTSSKSIALEPVIAPRNIDAIIPPKIEKRHLETVKDYVKWKIYAKPGVLFNPDLAKDHKADYIRGRNKLKLEVAKDYTEHTEVKPRSFVTGSVSAPVGFPIDL